LSIKIERNKTKSIEHDSSSTDSRSNKHEFSLEENKVNKSMIRPAKSIDQRGRPFQKSHRLVKMRYLKRYNL